MFAGIVDKILVVPRIRARMATLVRAKNLFQPKSHFSKKEYLKLCNGLLRLGGKPL
jgi:hypothetical protein